MKTLGRLAGRIFLGTGVYVAIVALASPLPSAAGMMLTFPALNGLAFFFSEDERALSIAKTMFWMPIVNGAFCAAYIASFLILAKTTSATALGWALLLIETVLWLAWVSRSHIRAGIDSSRQVTLAAAATLTGAVMAAVTMLLVEHLSLSPPPTTSTLASGDLGGVVAVLAHGKLKITLFAVTLAVLVSAVEYSPISDSARGILAGLPIVPFGGMASIAGDPSLGVDARVQMFLGMIGGVWLGAPIALWFIVGFSRYLGVRKRIAAQNADSLVRFAALLGAWLAAFAVIVAVAYAINALAADGAPS